MQDVIGTGEPLAFGERGIGSRVSWGAVLAGTVGMLAVTVILYALALAIVSLAMHPTGASLKGTGLSLWICGMVAVLIGAVVGGRIAGSAPRFATARSAMGHGFIAWGLAMLVSLVFGLGLMRGPLEAAAGAVADAMLAAQANVGAEGPSTAEPGFPYGDEGVRPGARDDAMRPGMRAERRDAESAAAEAAIRTLRGATWSWFGTWFVAGLLAVGAAGASRRRIDRVAGERVVEPERAPARPLTPAPTA